MARLPRSAFRRRLARLDAEAFASFVADLWAERGWETAIDGDTVIGTRPETGRRRVLLPVVERRWLPIPRRQRFVRPDADVVVSSGRGGLARTIADDLDARVVDAVDLYQMTLYAINRDAANHLLGDHLGLTASVPDGNAWDPLDAATRVALGAAAVLLLAVGLVGLGVVSLPGDSATGGAGRSVSPATVAPGAFELTTASRTPPETDASPARSGPRATPERTPIVVTPRPNIGDGVPSRTAIGVGSGAWPTRGFSPAGIGFNPHVEGPRAPVAAVGRRLDQPISSVAVVDGRVFVGRYDGRVYAFDAGWLSLEWGWFLGGRITSSPVTADGTVYAVSSTGAVVAIDAESGDGLWETSIVSGLDSPPSVANGTVFVSSPDGRVTALDAGTGAERWSQSVAETHLSAPAVATGTAYVSTARGAVIAIDARTGEVRWRRPVGGSILTTPTVANGSVFVLSPAARLYALDATTGAVRWEAHADGGLVSSPAVANGTVFVAGQVINIYSGTVRGRLYAFDAADGDRRWNATTVGPLTTGPSVTRETVYVGGKTASAFDGAADGRVYALDAVTGAERWNLTTLGPVSGAPAVVDGALYAGDGYGGVYLIAGCAGPSPPGRFPAFPPRSNGCE